MEKNELDTAEGIIRALNHEIKNPLTALKGYVQLLEVKKGNPEKISEYCEIMLRQVREIEKIFDSLYDSFEVSEPEICAVQIRDMIYDISTEFPHVNTRCVDPDMVVLTDPVLLKKILTYLVALNEAYDHVNVNIDAGGDVISLTYTDMDFTSLTERNFMLPYASAVYFREGNGLFASVKIASKLGMKLNFIKEKNIITVNMRNV